MAAATTLTPQPAGAGVPSASDTTLTLNNLNASTMRAPYTSASAPSMADTLPSLNFGFDDLRARMAAFTAQFDDFIEKGRARVLEERNRYRVDVGGVVEQQTQTRRALASLSSANTAHSEQLAQQAAETAEMHDAIASLTTTRDQRAANVATLRAKLDAAKQSVAQRRADRRERERRLSSMRRQDEEEVGLWEGVLGMHVAGTEGEDCVRFVFEGLADVAESKRPGSAGGRRRTVDSPANAGDAWFELDMSGKNGQRSYEVTSCRPVVDGGKVEDLVRAMCEREELGEFLKGMRGLFVEEFGERR